MALPTKEMMEDPKFQRRLVDHLLGYPRRWWQYPLCWLRIRRRISKVGFPLEERRYLMGAAQEKPMYSAIPWGRWVPEQARNENESV